MKNYKYPKSKVSLIYIFFKYNKVKVSLNEFLNYNQSFNEDDLENLPSPSKSYCAPSP